MASDLDEFAEDEAYADSVEDMCLDAYLEGVERDNAALCLQRAERLRCARAAVGRLRQLRKAATFIQCCARGHIARNMSRGMAVKQHNAAVTLQRFERGRSARYALRAERARLRRARLLAVGCVQRLTRGRIARREVHAPPTLLHPQYTWIRDACTACSGASESVSTAIDADSAADSSDDGGAADHSRQERPPVRG